MLERNARINERGSVRILIIEDHELSAHIATRFLTDLACIVNCAPNGQVALANFKDANGMHHYDLIFMDISLPDIGGYKLASSIRETTSFQNRPIPIIALTVHDDEDSKRRCLEEGTMDAMLVKPLLKTTAREVLNKFVPRWSVDNLLGDNDHAIATEEVPIIDFSYTLSIHNGDINFIKSALQIIIDNLDTELKQLGLVCEQGNWGVGRSIIHKLQGGIRYFGLMRLDKVFMQFTQILKDNPELGWLNTYNVLLEEVRKVEEAYQECCKSI